MCGRYNFEEREVFPGENARVYDREGALEPKWGFLKSDGKGTIINARSETAPRLYSFAGSFKRRRCLVPANGFYEWSRENDKCKYYFTVDGRPVIYLAGLYNFFKDGWRFLILTTAANDGIADLHDRMPVIIDKADARSWLEEETAAIRLLSSPGPPLCRRLESSSCQLGFF